MPSFQYSPSTDPSVFFESAASWTLTSVTATKAIWESGDQKLEVTGTGLSLAGGVAAGTITGVKLYEVDLSSGSAVDKQVMSSSPGLSISFAGLMSAVAESFFGFGGFGFIFGGNDTITGSAADDYMSGYGGNDSIVGNAGNDYLSGDDELNEFAAPGGRDTLVGGDGNDVLNGGRGNDSMVGGNGNDYYFVTEAGDLVVEASGSAAGSADRVNFSSQNGLLSYTLPTNVENLEVSPVSMGSAPITVTGRGNAQANKISVVDFSGGFNPSSTKLFGLDGSDRLTGGSGRDSLDGGNGNDTMIGGLGSDTYTVNALGDVVSEAIVFPVPNSDVDTLIFALTTTSTQTVSLGGAAQGGLTVAKTYSGIENLVLGTSSSAQARNGIGNDAGNVITGNAAANRLYGLNGNDTLNGGSGNDLLVGGSGNDSLVGGSGNDTLTGGAGLDIFRFSSALSTTNVDTITDFNPADDILQLENSVFTKLTSTGVLSASNFRASTTGNAADNNDFVLYETDTGQLFYDADGSGAGVKVLIATLTGLPTLTAADIFVT